MLALDRRSVQRKLGKGRERRKRDSDLADSDLAEERDTVQRSSSFVYV